MYGPLATIAVTAFQGRAGDHNDLAMPAAAQLGALLSTRLGTTRGDAGTRNGRRLV